jgi:hypothetical protein
MSERQAKAAVLRKQRAVARELRELAKMLDRVRPRSKFFEHPPFRVGAVCWG